MNATYISDLPPPQANLGDAWMDSTTGNMHIWIGSEWVINGFSVPVKPPFIPPTQEELEKHPALKAAWDEFMVLKKLIGI